VDGSRNSSRSGDAANANDPAANTTISNLNSGDSDHIVGGGATDPDDDDELGHTEFSAGDGRQVTINWNADTATTQGACVFTGHALAS
jgi:hypothetical protein